MAGPTLLIGLCAMAFLAKYRLILFAALAIGLIWTGFKAGGWQCAARQVAAIEEIRDEMARQATEFAAQQAIDAEAAIELTQNLAASRRSTALLRREIDNAKLDTGDCDQPFGAEFRRLWDHTIRPANDGPAPTG